MTRLQFWHTFAVRRRRERLVTTWKLRLVLVLLAGIVVWGTRGYWIAATAESLVCKEDIKRSDLILVDNSDQDYLSFENAANLRKAGLAPRVAVPTQADPHNPAAVHQMFGDFVGVMARVAWLGDFDMIPVPEQEPITLNVAYQVRDYVAQRNMRSVLISVPAFRSRRTMLIYNAVMRDTGVSVHCAPVFGRTTAENWTSSWHGIEGVAEQLGKLAYYRVSVLPFLKGRPSPSANAVRTP